MIDAIPMLIDALRNDKMSSESFGLYIDHTYEIWFEFDGGALIGALRLTNTRFIEFTLLTQFV